jgi:hypothetical protein
MFLVPVAEVGREDAQHSDSFESGITLPEEALLEDLRRRPAGMTRRRSKLQAAELILRACETTGAQTRGGAGRASSVSWKAVLRQGRWAQPRTPMSFQSHEIRGWIQNTAPPGSWNVVAFPAIVAAGVALPD